MMNIKIAIINNIEGGLVCGSHDGEGCRPPSRNAQLAPVASSDYCDFSLFSLFWPEIYSDPDLVRRRNPWIFDGWPGEKQRNQPLFFRCFPLFCETMQCRDHD